MQPAWYKPQVLPKCAGVHRNTVALFVDIVDAYLLDERDSLPRRSLGRRRVPSDLGIKR
jgi:hypothetical protein